MNEFKLTPEINTIISEYNKWNSRTSLNLILTLEASNVFTSSTFYEKMIFYSYKICNLNMLRKDEVFYNTIKQLEYFFTTSMSNADEFSTLIFLMFKIERLTETKEYNEVNTLIKQAQEISEKLLVNLKLHSNKIIGQNLCVFYFILIQYYIEKKEWNKALFYCNLRLEVAKNIDIPFEIDGAYWNLSLFYQEQNQYQESLKIYKERLDYFKSIKNSQFLIVCYLELSNFWLTCFKNIKESINYNDKVSNILNLIKDQSENVLMNHINFYIQKGDLFSFMGHFKESILIYEIGITYALKISNEFQDSFLLAQFYEKIGNAYEELQNFTKAISYQSKALKLRLKSNDPHGLSSSYYLLIKLNLKLGMIDSSKNYLIQFDNLLEDWKNYLNFVYAFKIFDLAKAFVLLEEGTLKSNSDAQILLKSVLADSKLNLVYELDAYLSLINLTILEFKAFQNMDTFREIEKLISNLKSLANNYNSIPLKIQSFILQGKLSLAKGDFTDFEENYNLSRNLAKEYELNNLEAWISNELNNFNLEILKWKNLIDTNSTLKILEAVEIQDYIKLAQQIFKNE